MSPDDPEERRLEGREGLSHDVRPAAQVAADQKADTGRAEGDGEEEKSKSLATERKEQACSLRRRN